MQRASGFHWQSRQSHRSDRLRRPLQLSGSELDEWRWHSLCDAGQPLLAAQVETGESGTEARLVQNSRPGSWQPIGSIVSSCASFGAHGFTDQSSVTNPTLL